jgi:hypothetical protein
MSLNDVLKNEFEAVAAVEIFDPAELHARWLKALPDEVKSHVSVEVGDLHAVRLAKGHLLHARRADGTRFGRSQTSLRPES